MAQSGLVKAEIVSVESGDRVKCLFNPKEYTFSKQNNWKDQQTGNNVPQIEFGGGQPASLQMELFFDTYAQAKAGGTPKDVRKEYTDKIWKLMIVDPKLVDAKNKKGRPPKVIFQWGQTWLFKAVIASITQKFTMFIHDGTPVRATLNVTFRQVEDEGALAKQNPTSGGTGGERLWTVSEGDTLGWIAHKEYGDTTKWRQIAEANRLTRVRRLPAGLVLVIPDA
ncbi:MAG TPA: hypothetical protein VFZ21_28555 [Gemmatimonadaceae bacterium]|jgi:nucleoid-associated protein YgaU|nr:hypothetical protein [Gemmatimonadaceae bacterium]